MFKILDGRDAFYQWDVDRKVEIKDTSINQVHFANFMSNEALVENAYNLNGKWVANVPNVLLEKNLTISVYGYDENYTKYEKQFVVKSRAVPDDYVYTDEDVKKWSDLEERIDELENKPVSQEAIVEGINTYFEANPIDYPVDSVNGKTGDVVLSAEDVGALPADTVIPSIEGLATEQYVDDAIANIDFPETDLSNYYTKSETNALIPNVSGFATEQYVNQAIANIDFPETDLSNYYTKAQTDALIPDVSGFALKSEIPDVSGFTTMSAVEAKGYQTATQVETAINTALDAIGVAEEGAY